MKKGFTNYAIVNFDATLKRVNQHLFTITDCLSFKVYLHVMIGFQYFNNGFYRSYKCSRNEMNNKSKTFGAFCNKLVSPTITTTSAHCCLPILNTSHTILTVAVSITIFTCKPRNYPRKYPSPSLTLPHGQRLWDLHSTLHVEIKITKIVISNIMSETLDLYGPGCFYT